LLILNRRSEKRLIVPTGQHREVAAGNKIEGGLGDKYGDVRMYDHRHRMYVPDMDLICVSNLPDANARECSHYQRGAVSICTGNFWRSH
jgi:hypothetical protein